MSEIISSREAAVRRIKARRAFATHLAAYVIVNGYLLIHWAVTGRDSGKPFVVLLGWGVGLAFHAWHTFGHQDITEADVERELRRTERD